MTDPKRVTRGFIRSTIWNMLWPARRCTASLRVLPKFLILGSQRAGTTSLHHWLSQHPLLCPSGIKEVHYFDGGLPDRTAGWERGSGWYSSHFPLRSTMPESGLAYETSPLYLFHPLAPQRVASSLPSVKMIVVLRDPTERAISHYWFERASGREPLSIGQAMDAEEARLASARASGDYNSDAFVWKSYKARGEYAGQLERWFSYFPRSSFLVLQSEDLFADPGRGLRSVCQFLGVEDYSFELLSVPRNAARRAESTTPALRARLEQHFAPHNVRLEQLLGPEFRGWQDQASVAPKSRSE